MFPIYKFVFVQNNIVLKMFFLFFLNQIELKPPLTQSVTRFFLYLVFLNLTSKRPFFSNISRLIAPYGGLFRDCLASLSLAIKINYHLRLRNDLYCTLNSCSLSITWNSFELCQMGQYREINFEAPPSFPCMFYQYLFGLSLGLSRLSKYKDVIKVERKKRSTPYFAIELSINQN